MIELLPGTEVAARGLRWAIVSSQNMGVQTMYRLRGLEGAVQGEEFEILSPLEPVQAIVHDFRPDRATSLRNWLVYHHAFLLEQALGPYGMLAVQPGRLEIQPYQLVPVLRAIRMSRVRLLLADGVGLGKTIQAGLVLTELIARRVAHRILIVSPAGPLLDQWKTEMQERFGLRLDVVDRGRLEEVRRGSELGANPFDHIPLGLVSIDFLKQERVLDLLERAHYDVVVIDEAHHCNYSGVAQDRDDSLRRRLAETLARRTDGLLLLTATPHDGFDRSFASLCELLDPSLVDGRGVLRGDQYRPHVVRRLKRHIKDPKTGRDLFKERKVLPRPVTADPAMHAPYMNLQRALLDLVAPELRRAFRARRYADVLSFIALLKRSVSTVEACRATLKVVAEHFRGLLDRGAESKESARQRLNTLREYHRRLERFGVGGVEEETGRHQLEIEDLTRQLAAIEREVRSGGYKLRRVGSVVEALDALVTLADQAVAGDPKLAVLEAQIREIRAQEPGASIIIYTEYTASQQAVVQAFQKAKLGEVLTLNGEDDEKTRLKTTARFRSDEGLILVSTDAAAEGLNLHQRCHHLIHLELPFNPNRLEQRNGRIDRFGQTKDPIVRYLYLRGTFEERILLRLIAKYERQRALLTFVPNTLGLTAPAEATNERLLQGMVDDDDLLFKNAPRPFEFASDDENEGTDAATRELLEEIDRSFKGFDKAAQIHTWLGTGLNADDETLTAVDAARAFGNRVTAVDLARFVTDAVLLDGGGLKGELTNPVFDVALPSAWSFGLDDLPGYDGQARTVRLTTRLEVTEDDQKRPVGFLGRAHPLVRRALDRVRNLSLGGSDRGSEDIRVSAVRAKVAKPALLCTFVGRVTSGAGREVERVLAVRVSASGRPEFLETSDQWLPMADPARAVPTRDLWKKHFAGWAEESLRRARAAAAAGFRPLAESCAAEMRRILEGERTRQEEWLRKRAEEISGSLTAAPIQAELFLEPQAPGKTISPPWATTEDPLQRLVAFARDRSVRPAQRSEAEGVVRIYRQRAEEIAKRMKLGEPEIVEVGALMLIPEDGHGA